MKRKQFQPDTPDDLLKKDFAGDCYRAAYQWVSASKKEGWTLVHGTVLSGRLEKRIGHAWCERGDDVVDLAMPVSAKEIKRDEYYRVLQPEVSRRYPAEHAVFLFLRNRHYGPWEDWEQLSESLLAELGSEPS